MAPPTTATGAFFRRLKYGFDWPAIFYGACWGLLVFSLLLLFIIKPYAHDWKRPDLDQWYGSLQRPGVQSGPYGGTFSCCSKTDCHPTQAELRGDDWWARIGVPQPNGDWDLRDWVKVPADKVLQQHDNPTGEGVICHSIAWGMSLPGQEQHLNVAGVTIWCFIPPTES